MIFDRIQTTLEKDTLQDLAKTLPTYLLQARATNTTKSYKNGYQKWRTWAANYELQEMPANPISLALFLLSLIQSNHSVSSVENSYYGIKYYHKTLLHDDPMDHPLPKAMLDVAKRRNKKLTTRKSPLTLENLTDIYTILNTVPTLTNVRCSTMILLGFMGFLRFDELSRIRYGDISFHETYLKIFIESSKTDKYRDGCWVHLAANNSKTCPVKNLKQYLLLAGLEHDDHYIFRGISKTKNGEKLRTKNTPLSYTRVRELVLSAFKSIDLPVKNFGTHSLRSGGATLAANSGIADRLFKRHGRWATDASKDLYVQDNIEQLLSVTRSMCIE